MKTVARTLTILLCLSFAGYSFAQQTIKVGAIPIVHELPLRAAIVNGYLAQEGIKVQPEILAGGAVLIPALAGGSLQMGHSAYVTAFQARDAGFDITILFPYAEQSRGRDPNAMMIRADSGTKGPKDLEGKRLAVNVLRSILWLYDSEWMAANGADPNKVQWVELPFPNMVPALRAGQVDAVSNTEPFVALEMEKGGLVILVRDMTAVHPTVQVSGIVATERWVKANRDLAERFARALRKGSDYVNQNPEKWGEILATYTQLRPEWIPKLVMPQWRYPASVEGLQLTSDLALKWGLVKKKQNVKDFIWPTALAK